MRQIVTKIKYLVLILLVFCITMPALTTRAQESGSIRLIFSGEVNLENVTMTLYQVADSSTASQCTGAFAASGVTIPSMDDADALEKAAEQLASYAEANGGITGTTMQSAGQEFTFTGLDEGVYLIVQTSGTDVIEIQKILVAIPYLDENGTLSWDAELSPKYDVPDGSVILTKTDDAGEAVPGAVFTLQKKVYVTGDGSVGDDVEGGADVNGRYIWQDVMTDLTADENGQIEVSPLSAGFYRFVETMVPEGYVQQGATQFFEIVGSGTASGEDPGDEETEAVEVSAENTRTKVEIDKIDEEGDFVAGAELVVKDADGNVIRDEDGNAKYVIHTGESASLLYMLPAGNYYLSEVVVPDGYQYAPDVAFTVQDETDELNLVVMEDPEEDTNPDETAELTVTKDLLLINGDRIIAGDASYYVALFSDPECTQRVSGVKTILYQGTSVSSVTFEGLEPGTYYIAETDEFGDALDLGVTDDGVMFMPEYPGGEIAPLTVSAGDSAEFEFENEFYDLPDGYYYSGELTVTKLTVRSGEPCDSDDTFYARAFFDADYTDPASDVLELDMDGGSSSSYTIEVSVGNGSSESSETYYVTETDADGNPVANGSGLFYTMTIDKGSVTMSLDNMEENVTITNTFTDETTTTTTTTGGDTGTTTTDTGTATETVQTGDQTPVTLYLAIVIIAAVIIIIVVILLVIRRRRRA